MILCAVVHALNTAQVLIHQLGSVGGRATQGAVIGTRGRCHSGAIYNIDTHAVADIVEPAGLGIVGHEAVYAALLQSLNLALRCSLICRSVIHFLLECQGFTKCCYRTILRITILGKAHLQGDILPEDAAALDIEREVVQLGVGGAPAVGVGVVDIWFEAQGVARELLECEVVNAILHKFAIGGVDVVAHLDNLVRRE